jgi:hypothetical protein
LIDFLPIDVNCIPIFTGEVTVVVTVKRTTHLPSEEMVFQL